MDTTKNKLVPYGFIMVAVLTMINFVVNTITIRRISTQDIAILIATLIAFFLLFKGGKQNSLIGFIILAVKAVYSLAMSIRNIQLLDPNIFGFLGICLELFIFIVGIINNKDNGKNIKKNAIIIILLIIFRSIIMVVTLGYRLATHQPLIGILPIITTIILCLILLIDIIVFGHVFISTTDYFANKESSSTKNVKIVIIVGCIYVLLGLCLGAIMAPPSRRSSKPWDDLGVSKAEYMQTYKEVYDRTY